MLAWTYDPIQAAAALLRLHSIPVQVGSDRLLALDIVVDRDGRDVSEWIDVTGWSRKQIYEWLGY